GGSTTSAGHHRDLIAHIHRMAHCALDYRMGSHTGNHQTLHAQTTHHWLQRGTKESVDTRVVNFKLIGQGSQPVKELGSPTASLHGTDSFHIVQNRRIAQQ